MRMTLANWFAVGICLVAGGILPPADVAYGSDSSLDLDLTLPRPVESSGNTDVDSLADFPILLPPEQAALAPVPIPRLTESDAKASTMSKKQNKAPSPKKSSRQMESTDLLLPVGKPKLSRPQSVSPFLAGKLPQIYSPRNDLDLPIPPAPPVKPKAKESRQSEPATQEVNALELLPTKKFPVETPAPSNANSVPIEVPYPEVPFLRSERISPPVGTGVKNDGSAAATESQTPTRVAERERAAAPTELPQELPILPPVASLRRGESRNGNSKLSTQQVDITSQVEQPVIPRRGSPESLTTDLRLVQSPNVVSNVSDTQIQFDNDLPQLRVSTVGPDTLMLGKAASYLIRLNNKSNFAAHEVEVRCALPSWVKLDSHKLDIGSVQSNEQGILWRLDEVAARAEQTLALDLVPQAGKAFELNVNIAVQPSKARKRIAVQEPKLAIDIEGPGDLLFNEPGSWNVTVTNPGTGDAEGVLLEILSGSKQLESRDIGTIAAGQTVVANLELSAAEIGAYMLLAKASGGAANAAEDTSEFVCRRGVLAVDVRGTDMDYVGSAAKYEVVLRNTGDAASKNVLVNLDVPQGMRYRSGLSAPTLTAGGVSWIVDRLGVGEQKVFSVEMAIEQAGDHEIRATVSSADQQTAENSLVIESLTSADLKLSVIDPSGPQPVNRIHEYTIELLNRGTEAARNISIIAVCPPEVEPVDVTGNAAIKSGQIFFKMIPNLQPSHKISYKVMARAKRSGHHGFRVIVKCYEPNLRLAAEESTTYFDRSDRSRKAISLLPKKSKREPEVATRPKVKQGR